MADLFPNFETHRVSVPSSGAGDAAAEPIEIFCRRRVPATSKDGATAGKALLLIHGHPQTHHIWHRVAAQLVEQEPECELVVVDTRGMGQSSKPAIRDAQGRSNYTKRRCADDLVAVMRHFGHQSFYVAGHDRGARIGHRMLVDHGASVVRSAVFIDIAPTVDMYRLGDSRFGMLYWHWYFLAQPAPIPETFLVSAPEAYLGRLTNIGRGSSDASAKVAAAAAAAAAAAKDDVFHPTAVAAYRGNIATMDSAAAMCEDYRASAPGGEDAVADEEDRAAGRKVPQPLHLLWGSSGVIELLYGGAVDLWQQRCEHPVQARPVETGHYVPEEAPEEVVKEIRAVLRHE
ncbi:uncharacterized protein PFL1_01844 [Pseudozyma flocculosa PF-1]|uniref:Related to haloacetate dehalogenase H-1 n=1 Tax=Pseudozyma flocculosa TaxID=84751 RepID=A0A5C3EYV3_9BASI|nr:uncharacterized protein PFL1_01844 [Pseudozyma flocculosa PF-1]EPQ30318.1 hypothetical protein PFL1_01844 [Pseudozyma flocculosa PF-1]SPO37388.1 related to haloacetate dehalogenase H-1 [Pseudozyma flocculosa]